MREAIRVDDDQRAKLLRFFPERRESRIGQFLARDVGEDLHALEPELRHAALQLLGGFIAVGHRHRADCDEAVGLLRDIFGETVIDHAGGLDGDVERHRVVALRRRRRDELHIEAHGVEVGQALVKARNARAQVPFLLFVDGARLGGLEVNEGDGRGIDMRLREGGRLRHTNMRVDVKGQALGPDLPAWPVVPPRRRCFVFVPDIRHADGPP
jgi:hypothetical protein